MIIIADAKATIVGMIRNASIILSTFSFNHRDHSHLKALSQALEPGTQAPAAPSIEIPSAPMRKSSSVAKMKRRIIGATVPVPRRDGIGGALSGGAAGW